MIFMATTFPQSVSIQSKGDYLIFKIPKSLIALKKKTGDASVEDTLLALFARGQKEFKAGKLKPINSLADLVKQP